MKLLALRLCLACSLLASQPALAAEITLPTGTVVTVKLTEPIDSDRDSLDGHDNSARQYAAVLAAPVVVPGALTIPGGSPATISLLHNNSGWLTQLATITVDGRTLSVASSAGVIVTSQQGSAEPGFIHRLIGPSDTPPAPTRIQLAPSTQLRFSLIGSSAPARPARVARRGRSAPRSRSSFTAYRSAPAASDGIAYLCDATDTSDRATTSYYVADVLKTFDTPAQVESSWHQFLVATYPYRFANNPRAVIRCTRITDADAGRPARIRLQGELNSDSPGTIQTRWRYTLGPPPTAATDSAPATAAPPPQPPR